MKIDPADKYFSLWIKHRDGWKCQRCTKWYDFLIHGSNRSLQCSHFQGRRKESTRFDPDNCDALCAGCHMYFTANPAEHYQWQVERKGQKLVDAIVLRSNMYKKKDRKLEALAWKQRLLDDFGIKV